MQTVTLSEFCRIVKKVSKESKGKLKYPVQIIEDLGKRGYTVSVPDLPGCITRCQRWQDIPAMIEDAKCVWITAAIEEGIRMPEPTDINKRGEISMKGTSCEYCANYTYDEECDEYYCDVNLDEDEYYRFVSSDYKECPYYRSGDEYKVVRHQM